MISLTVVLLLAAKIIAVLVVGNLIKGAIVKVLDKSNMEVTLAKFLKTGLKFVVLFIECLVIASLFGVDITSVIAFGSVFAAAFALAAQGSLSNLFGGILLLISKPFVVGDYIITSGIEGSVKEISILNTKIDTVDNKLITIPNGAIASATITNCSTEGKRRVDLVVSASYDCKVEDVKAAINEAIENTNLIIEGEPVFVRVSEYGANAISYTIRVWTLTPNYWSVYFDLLENVKVYFDKNNIQMTYNHIIVHTEK